MSVAQRARMTLVDLVCRAVAGQGLRPEEIPEVEGRLRLFGFRKTARAFLLRRMARSAVEAGGITILSPALDGLFTLAVSGEDFGVGWDILERGTYEPHIVAFYRHHLRPGMTVLDVGANIGFHTLHAASLVGRSGRVFAVEPDPGNASLLKLSLSLQPEEMSVEVIEAALSDRDQELVLTDLGNAANSGARFTHPDRSRLEEHVHGPNPQFRTVRALRWDDHFPDQRIDLVKIDIEGFEPRALAGMEGTLARDRPVIVSEFAPSNLSDIGETKPSDYLAWFDERDYTCSVLDDQAGDPSPATPDEVFDRTRDLHHVDLLFRPR